jgi:hypothetical protein
MQPARPVEVAMAWRYGRLLMLALLTAVLAAGAAPAYACSLDGVPSLSVNGKLPILNPLPALNSAQLQNYAPFIFTHTFAVHATITFSENRTEVAKTVNARDMVRPWRWRFGDGAIGYGWTVKHAYSHARQVRLSVDAYDPGTKQWYEFDRVQLRVGH